MDEVTQLCDRVIFLDRGRIASSGRPEDLAASAAATRVRLRVTEGLPKAPGATSTPAGCPRSIDDGVVEVEIDEARLADFLAGLAAAGVRYREIAMRKPTLEDYFLKLAADAARRGRTRRRPTGTMRRGGPAMRASLGRIVAMILRHLYLVPRTLESWGETLYWPVVDLLLWGLTTRWVESSPGSVPRLALIVLTGVVFWQIVWRANYEISVNLLEEFWNQNMANLFATPLSVWEWSVSLVALGLIKNLLTVVVGIGGVWLLYSLNIFEVGWMLLPFLFSLMMSGWFMGFTSSALIIYYGRRLQNLAWMLGYAHGAVLRRVLSRGRAAGLGAGGRGRAADDVHLRGHAPDPPGRPAAIRGPWRSASA